MSSRRAEGKSAATNRYRYGLLAAAAYLLYAVLMRVLWMPLHAAGVGQPVTGYLNGLGWVLQMPGAFAARRLGVTGHPYLLGNWLVGLALNVPVYFLLGVLCGALWSDRPLDEPSARPGEGLCAVQEGRSERMRWRAKEILRYREPSAFRPNRRRLSSL